MHYRNQLFTRLKPTFQHPHQPCKTNRVRSRRQRVAILKCKQTWTVLIYMDGKDVEKQVWSKQLTADIDSTLSGEFIGTIRSFLQIFFAKHE